MTVFVIFMITIKKHKFSHNVGNSNNSFLVYMRSWKLIEHRMNCKKMLLFSEFNFFTITPFVTYKSTDLIFEHLSHTCEYLHYFWCLLIIL